MYYRKRIFSLELQNPCMTLAEKAFVKKMHSVVVFIIAITFTVITYLLGTMCWSHFFILPITRYTTWVYFVGVWFVRKLKKFFP